MCPGMPTERADACRRGMSNCILGTDQRAFPCACRSILSARARANPSRPGSLPDPYPEPVTTMSTKSVLRPPGATTAARSVSLTDRLAMRLGMALILWSRRTRAKRPPVDLLLAEQLRRERAAREAEWVMLGATMHMWR